jgi:hypothetical protein
VSAGLDRFADRGRQDRIRADQHRRPGPAAAARRAERRGLPEDLHRHRDELQLDALNAEGCLKIYTDTATGTTAGRPQWNTCLADLRPGDTLIVWKIDRLGRNLRDLIDIVTTLETRGVAVKSLTNGIVDTTTAYGKLIFGMFALMAEYEHYAELGIALIMPTARLCRLGGEMSARTALAG